MANPTKRRTDSSPVLTQTDGYELGGATTANPPIDPRRIITTDLTRSHIASSVDLGYWQTDRALSMSIDDVEDQFGVNAYEKMFRVEPTCAGIMFSTRANVIGKGARLKPAFDKPPEFNSDLQMKRDWDQAQRFRDYGQEVISRLDMTDDNIITTIADQMRAKYLGHTLAEKELNYLPAGNFKGAYCLQSLRVKPHENYTVVLDEMNRFRGVTAKVPGVSVMVWKGIIGDASFLANAISPEALLILTCGKQGGDVRGVSMARALWDPYTRLQKHIKPDMVRAGHQFGGGMITVIGPEKFLDVNVIDPDTNQPVNIMVMIKKQVTRLGGGGVAVLPFGCQVTVHYPTGEADLLGSMYDKCVQEMYQRWFGSAEAFITIGPNSQANADTAQDTVGAATRWDQNWISTAYSTGLFQPLVRRSFGEEFVKYAPVLELNPDNDVDFAADLTAYGGFSNSAAWDDSLAPDFDDKFGLRRDPNWVAKKQARADAAAKSAQPVRPQEESAA